MRELEPGRGTPPGVRADTAELVLQHSAEMEAVAAEGRAMKELLLSSLSPEELQAVLAERLPASRRNADEVPNPFRFATFPSLYHAPSVLRMY